MVQELSFSADIKCQDNKVKAQAYLLQSMSGQLSNMLQVLEIHILGKTLTSWSKYRGMQPLASSVAVPV